MCVSAIVAGGLGIASAVSGNNASKRAANAQTEAANSQLQLGREQMDLQERIYDQNVARLRPYEREGRNAFNMFSDVVTGQPGAMNAFEASPGYQFRLEEAQRGIEAAANARGSFFSGGTLQAIGDRQQDVASGEFNNWLGNLRGLGQMGMNAAAGQGAAGTNFANQSAQTTGFMGNAFANMGDAQAAGAIGQANAFNSGINNAFQMYGYMNQPSAANFNASPSNPAFFSGLY